MKWTPRHWNDVLAILLLIGLPLYWRWLMAAGISQDVLMVIVGALLGHFGQVVTYYFRKAPPSQETEPNPDTVAHG